MVCVLSLIMLKPFQIGSETENGDIQKELKYLDHTTKNLDMIRVFLKNPVKDDKTNKAGMPSLKNGN